MKASAHAIALEARVVEHSGATTYNLRDVSHDTQQVRAAIGGDAVAMRAIYEREAPRLLRRLDHLCGDEAMAQDLLQECFLRAFAGEVAYAGTSAVAAWLHGVAVNLWRNEQRKRQRQRGLLKLRAANVEPASLASPSDGHEHDELQQRLRVSLASLKPDLREAFVLRVLEQLPLAEAAAMARVSLATLSRRARQGEASVRAHFEQDRPPTRNQEEQR